MDVLFVNGMDTMQMSNEINGTLLLGSILLNAGFDVDVLRFCQVENFSINYPSFIKNIVQKIIDLAPKILSFYSLWPDHHIMLRIANEVRAINKSIIIIFGGPQATATALETMNSFPCVDYVSSGEGDCIIVPLINEILYNNGSNVSSIPGLYYRVKGSVFYNNQPSPLCDLDSLPFWDDRLYVQHHNNENNNFSSDGYYMPIDVGRGCPFNCSFCYTCKFWKRTYRLKSVDRIISEIRYFMDKFGIRSFRFSHDAFTANKKLVEEVCDRIIKEQLNIRWECTSRMDCLTEDLVRKMKNAGMVQLQLGIESGSPRIQKLINKNLDLSQVRAMTDFLLSNNISVVLFFIFGIPGETEEDISATLSMNLDMIDMKVTQTNMAFCQFSPKSALTEQYLKDLVFTRDIKTIGRNVFGFNDELDVIKANKEIFPFFFHLDTPERNNYQFLGYFSRMYRIFPNSIKYLRNLYNGDDLQFYKDLVSNNTFFNDGDGNYISKYIAEHAPEILDNTMKRFSLPWIPKLKELFRFEHSIWLLSYYNAEQDLFDVFGFKFSDFKNKLPIEDYSDGKTRILLRRKNGKVHVQVIP